MESGKLSRKSRVVRLAVLGCAVPILWYAPARAATIVPGFSATALPANDDGSTSQVDLGFNINFYGGSYSKVYVNNNGNITFDGPKYNYRPDSIPLNSTRILSAFLGDVDTRGTGSGLMAYGTGTYNGHNAFGATWTNVGYFSSHADKLDTFQIIVEELPATSSGDFAVHYLYQDIQWDTSDTHTTMSSMVGISDGVAYNQQVAGSMNTPGGVLTNTGANALIKINGTGIQTYTIANNIWIGGDADVWKVDAPGWTRGVWKDDVTPAFFDGRGIANVNLTGDVKPIGIVVSTANGSKDYIFSGIGKITGTGWLTKRDNNTLTLLNDNTFTGGTFLVGGTIVVGDGVTDGHLPGDVSMLNSSQLVFKPGVSPTAQPPFQVFLAISLPPHCGVGGIG